MKAPRLLRVLSPGRYRAALEVEKQKTLVEGSKYAQAVAKSRDSQRQLIDQFKREAYEILGKTIKDWKAALDLARDPQEANFADLQDFYEGILIDGHLSAVRDTIKDDILSKHFLVMIDGETDDELTELLNKSWFRSYCDMVLDAQDFGYSLIEFLPPVDGEFREVVLVPRRHCNPVFRTVHRDPYNTTDRTPFEKLKGADYLLYAQAKNYHGLLNAAAPQVCLKKLAQQFWARYMELFGIPFRSIRVNREDEGARTEAEKLIKDMGSAFGMVLGPDEELEIKEPSNRDAFQVFQKMEERRDAEISKLFLGQTLTTEGGGDGSTHYKVLQKRIRQRTDLLEIHINDFLKPFLVRHGYPAQLEKATIKANPLSGLSPQQLTTIWAEGAQFGYRPDKKAMEKLLGIELEEMDGVAGSTSKENVEAHYYGPQLPSAAHIVQDVRSLYDNADDCCN